MLRAEHFTYSMAGRPLYENASFTIEEGQHCALIGSNGSGKTTLIDLLLNPEDFLFKGKVFKEKIDHVGYVNQFVDSEKNREISAYGYLCEDFDAMQKRMDELCEAMETAEDSDKTMEDYQSLMDEYMAIDGYDHEVNIGRQLRMAGLEQISEVPLSAVSGGEYKLLQIIRQMLSRPELLVMDEPDVFLDFDNLSGLRELINAYPGTVLVATHNRFLLNHCFNKMLQIEDLNIHEFDGTYIDFCLTQLQMKIDMQEASIKEADFIAFEETVIERMRDDATKHDSLKRGKTLRARVSYVERWKARHIKEPYIETRMPSIKLPDIENIGGECILRADNYSVGFDELLLGDVSFEMHAGDKVALVGPNGTGKTTLLRDIFYRRSDAITLGENVNVDFLSQFHGETLDEDRTVWALMEELGFENRDAEAASLSAYCFERDVLDQPIRTLSGGEKNLLQLMRIGIGNASLLLLDEPTSHLDLRSQLALERAIEGYKGAVLMVSHDFYSIANCVDYVLYAENNTVRRMSGRAFRKMIYKRHFPQNYLELEQKKKELELQVNALINASDCDGARAVMAKLEEVTGAMQA